MKKYKLSTFDITLGGMFIAIFFFASNLIPPIFIVPQVPVTLQIMVVALMGGILGVRSGLINIFALYLATVVGLPLMSGFGGGLQVFARPTTGFIVGFAFVVLMAGICHDIFAHRVNAKLFSVLFMLFSFIGVLICYGFGSAWLVIYNHTGFIAFGTVFKANLAFLPFDAVKCIVASAIATSFAFVPSLKKLAKSH